MRRRRRAATAEAKAETGRWMEAGGARNVVPFFYRWKILKKNPTMRDQYLYGITHSLQTPLPDKIQ